MSDGKLAHPSNNQLLAVQNVVCRLIERAATLPREWTIRLELNVGSRWLSIFGTLQRDGFYQANTTIGWHSIEHAVCPLAYVEQVYDALLASLETRGSARG